ncbi:MAG: HlyC/CorC family transporter [SAR202 cluster bacterium]|nr:HlyC/CorC family transporter [SAR202 cluster bacterium]
MEESDYLKLGLFILCVVLSSFFSTSETSFISLQKVRLVHLARTGAPGAKRVLHMAERPERLLATVLTGNNLANTAAAALGTAIAISLLGNTGSAVIIATVIVTVVLLIFAEALPKTLATRRAEKMAFLLVRPLQLVEWVLLPAVWLLDWAVSAIARLFGTHARATMVTEQEIRSLIYAGKEAGSMEATEAEMLEKVFHFGDRQVYEIMTPRPEIVWVEDQNTLQEFLALYGQNQHTRFPVFRYSVDNVVGTLSAKDVLKAMSEGVLRPQDRVSSLSRPAFFVPETKGVGVLFTEMRERGESMAIIADEFGGVAGIVTIKQLMEVIVGPVGEEGQPLEEQFEAINENTYLIDASMSIEAANQLLSINLPEGDYQTVAGLLLERLGRIPSQSDYLDYADLRITVKAMDGLKIDEVEVQKRARVAGGRVG